MFVTTLEKPIMWDKIISVLMQREYTSEGVKVAWEYPSNINIEWPGKVTFDPPVDVEYSRWGFRIVTHMSGMTVNESRITVHLRYAPDILIRLM